MENNKITSMEELAVYIDKQFSSFCAKQPCGECHYAFKESCRVLFTLNFLKNHENMKVDGIRELLV